MMVLAAFGVACAIILSGILALKMVAECSRRLFDRWLPATAGSRRPSVPSIRVRSEVPV